MPNISEITFRCEDEKTSSKSITEMYTEEYEDQLRTATETEEAYEKKSRSRTALQDFVSSI